MARSPRKPTPKSTGRAKEVARQITGKDHFPGSSVSKRSPEREQKFLKVLEDGFSITKACEAAGINRFTATRWRREDEAKLEGLDPENPDHFDQIQANFAFRWEIAIEAGNETIEDEATRRAVKGVEEAIISQGEIIGTKTVYSDTLMAIMLKGRQPHRYNPVERKELSGPNGGPIPTGIEIEFVKPTKKGKK